MNAQVQRTWREEKLAALYPSWPPAVRWLICNGCPRRIELRKSGRAQLARARAEMRRHVCRAKWEKL